MVCTGPFFFRRLCIYCLLLFLTRIVNPRNIRKSYAFRCQCICFIMMMSLMKNDNGSHSKSALFIISVLFLSMAASGTPSGVIAGYDFMAMTSSSQRRLEINHVN